MKVFLYIRVSTQEQALEGYSIKEQEERLRKYAEALGWTVVKVYIDPGHTGADVYRPGLQQMIKDVKSGLADKILVYKLDRLSRSQKDTLTLIEDVFEKNNTAFVSMTENLDTSTPMGKLMVGILSAFAQLERETIKERMTMGREGRAKKGLYSGSNRNVIGYNYINGELVPNDYEAMLVNECFKLFNAGTPIKTIEHILNDKGLTHSLGKWNSQTVRRVLENRHYIGEVKFKKQWYAGAHTAIVDEETFNTAQKILTIRAENYTGSNKPTAPLIGFCFCGNCGGKYHLNRGRVRQDGTKLEHYICYSRSKKVASMVVDRDCKNKVYDREELEGLIFGEIKKLATVPGYFEEALSGNVDDEHMEKRRLIEKEITSLSNQISNFMDLYSINRLTLQEVDDKIAPLADKRQKLEEELEELTKANDAGLISQEEAKLAAESFGDILDRGDLNEIRLVISTLIKRIVIKDEDIKIYWNIR